MVFSAERTITSEFWLFALISDPLAFLILVFAPVNLARVRNVALLTFGKLFIVLGFLLGYLLQWISFIQPLGAFSFFFVCLFLSWNFISQWVAVYT